MAGAAKASTRLVTNITFVVLSAAKIVVMNSKSTFNIKLYAIMVSIFIYGCFLRSDLIGRQNLQKLTGGNSKAAESQALVLELPPGTTSVILNIGSNIDPIIPHPSDGPCAMAIAFEPIVPCQVPTHPQLQVVPAAIGSFHGLATMTVMNEVGVSSSLSKPATTSKWNSDQNRDGKKIIVPVLPFQDILNSIPTKVRIDFIKTDMQGHDFAAVSSVGKSLLARGVPRLLTEVYFDDVQTYVGVDNDFCRDWLPYMTSVGYELAYVSHFSSSEEAKKHCDEIAKTSNRTYVGGLKEGDAYWRHPSAVSSEANDMSYYSYPVVQTGTDFTAEEYATCFNSSPYPDREIHDRTA